MSFVFKDGFDQFADLVDLLANNPAISGVAPAVDLLPDASFNVPNGKFLSSDRSKPVGRAYNRSIPLPITAEDNGSPNAICFGCHIIVPDVVNPFQGVVFATNPIMQANGVEVRLGTGVLGEQNKLVLTADGTNYESTFELIGGGLYYVSVSIEAETVATGGDARVVLKANKTLCADTGNAISLGATAVEQQLTNVIEVEYFSPTPTHHWGFDNMFCVDEFQDPPYFYLQVRELDSVNKRAWGTTGTETDPLTVLTDDDDGTYLFTLTADDFMTLGFDDYPVLDGRLTDEIDVIMRMSRGNNGLVDVSVRVGDGITVFGEKRESVAGSAGAFLEQTVTVKLDSLRNIEALNIDVINRRVV